MRMERYQFMRGFAILALISLFFVLPATSDEIPDLTGVWTRVSQEQYADDTGYVNLTGGEDSLVITTQDNRAFTGYDTYADTADGSVINETLSGITSADGKHFWRDHEDSGVSFGDILSDHEILEYMLLPGEPSMVIRSYLAKEGTAPSAEIHEPTDITGEWNYTHIRPNDTQKYSGIFNTTLQQGSIFTGELEFPEEDGSILELKVKGIIGTDNNLYALADNDALYIGSIGSNDEIHVVVVHPGDEDGTFVVDRWMTRDGKSSDKAPEYPDISGAWNITARTTIQNGTITHTGAQDAEWLVNSKSSGPFFTLTRYSDDPVTPPVIDVQGVFFEKGAFLASGGPTYVMYHFPDDDTIEAIVMKRDGESMMYLDTLKRSE